MKSEEFKSMENQLDIDSWGVGGRSLNVCRIEPDFPEWLYVRQETLDIFRVFKAQMEANLNTVFVGAPGGGKSMLVLLLAFFMAVRQRKRVVLFRKLKGKGFDLVYMDGKNKQYWRIDRAGIEDLDLVRDQNFDLCLDGLGYNDIQRDFGRLARYRLLATPDPYPLKNDDMPVLRKCLVPFWSLSDLTAIGAHREWSDHEIKDRYFYSGGNLRAFLAPMSSRMFAKNLINDATLVGIPANDHDHRDVGEYLYCFNWVCVITSEYALRCLGGIVPPSYYKELWAQGRLLADDGLMDTAFRNYVHTLTRTGEKMELQVREYDGAKESSNTYTTWAIEAKACRSDGVNAAECEAVMKERATPHVDYWYPSAPSLATIDCVAKLSIERGGDAVGLIQIATSDHRELDLEAVDKYGKLFPDRRHITLVPNKQTCDAFRFSPAALATDVPLHVAYMTAFEIPLLFSCRSLR